MKLVFISDTHTFLPDIRIPDGDILIHCGDALSIGDAHEFNRFAREMTRLSIRFKKVLYTPGNHDIFVQRDVNLCHKIFRNASIQLTGDIKNAVIMLIDEQIELGGIKFYGSPWTPQFYDWAFMYPREAGKEIWEGIPKDTDVLFTHGMPYGILDEVAHGGHVGCQALLDRINLVKPKVVAGGHLHLNGGQSIQINETLFINAAICDESYNPTRKPIVVDTETWSVSDI